MAAPIVPFFDDPIGNAGILLCTSPQHKKCGFRLVAPQEIEDRWGSYLTRTVIIRQNKDPIFADLLA
jgi:hypothetical protein